MERVTQAGFDTLADLARETNERLGHLEGRVEETNGRLGRLEGRFDNLIDIAGRETRSLRRDVDELQTRVDDLERKVS